MDIIYINQKNKETLTSYIVSKSSDICTIELTSLSSDIITYLKTLDFLPIVLWNIIIEYNNTIFIAVILKI